MLSVTKQISNLTRARPWALSNWSCGGSTAAPSEPLSMISFPPPTYATAKVELLLSATNISCIRPATLLGEVAGLVEVLRVADRNNEIGSTHLPCYSYCATLTISQENSVKRP